VVNFKIKPQILILSYPFLETAHFLEGVGGRLEQFHAAGHFMVELVFKIAQKGKWDF
jgi:hypothetical protein